MIRPHLTRYGHPVVSREDQRQEALELAITLAHAYRGRPRESASDVITRAVESKLFDRPTNPAPYMLAATVMGCPFPGRRILVVANLRVLDSTESVYRARAAT